MNGLTLKLLVAAWLVTRVVAADAGVVAGSQTSGNDDGSPHQPDRNRSSLFLSSPSPTEANHSGGGHAGTARTDDLAAVVDPAHADSAMSSLTGASAQTLLGSGPVGAYSESSTPATQPGAAAPFAEPMSNLSAGGSLAWSSVADPSMGRTSADIAWTDRLSKQPPNTEPARSAITVQSVAIGALAALAAGLALSAVLRREGRSARPSGAGVKIGPTAKSAPPAEGAARTARPAVAIPPATIRAPGLRPPVKPPVASRLTPAAEASRSAELDATLGQPTRPGGRTPSGDASNP